MTTPHGTAPQYEKAQRDEWSKYVARVPIDFYGVRAYNTGDPVPASAVGDDPAAGQWVSPEYVAKTGGKTGTEPFTDSGTVVPPEPPTIDPTAVAAPAASSPDAAPKG